MFTRRFLKFLFFLGFFAVRSAFSADPVGTVGLGASVGRAQDRNDFLAIIEGHTFLKQKKNNFGFRTYGFTESRTEIGNSLGLSLNSNMGITVLGIRDSDRIFPHLGVEPYNGRLTLSTRASHKNYYAWIPMISGGFQLAIGNCRLLPLFRAGGALTNVTRTDIWPEVHGSYGFGSHFNCAGFDFGLELTRIPASSSSVDLASMDLAFKSFRNWELGLRAEGLSFYPKTNAGMLRISQFNDASEARFLLALRGKWYSVP